MAGPPFAARLFPAACLVAAAAVLLLSCPAGMALVGGKTERLASDPDIQEAAAFAVDAYNKASNSLFYSKVSRILKAESQVVAGVKYYLKIEVVNTVCEKRGNAGLKQVDLEHCSVPSEAEQKKLICEFQVWSRPWLNKTELLKMSCTAEMDHGAST